MQVKAAETKRDAAKERVELLKNRLKTCSAKVEKAKVPKAPQAEVGKVKVPEVPPAKRKRMPLDPGRCPACQQEERKALGLIQGTSARHWASCNKGWKRLKEEASDSD